MKLSTLHIAYFSPTYTTRKVVREIAGQISSHIVEHDLTEPVPSPDIVLNESEEAFLVGMPVYAGRIPPAATAFLDKFKSNGAPAIVVCVYGNRAYEDALLELKNRVESHGFKVIGAGAFIARHSIFPTVATRRPDENDKSILKDFGAKCAAILSKLETAGKLPELKVKGNKPYRQPRPIPLHPAVNRRCNGCNTCVKFCPVQAIQAANPRKTNKQQCISCGRCIVICPQKARRFGGLLYKIAGWKFAKNNAERKEPETFLVSL